jgi:PDDEXK-like domain of unknown function (DUF3799)
MRRAAAVDEASRALAAYLAETTALDLPHGLHFDVPEEQYHRKVLGLASRGALDEVKRSAAHYYAWLTAEDEDTPTFHFGRDFHTATLESSKYAPRTGTKKERSDAEAIRGMVASLRRHPIAAALLFGHAGDCEVTVRWDAGGVPCKARVDRLLKHLPVAIDLKSTSAASPAEFARSVAHYGYHRQDAFYRDGLAAVGHPVDAFVFVAVEKSPPYAVGVYTLPEAWIDMGRRSIARDLATLADCCASGVFPGYADRIIELEATRWAVE